MRRLLVYVVLALGLATGAYVGLGADGYVLIRLGDTAMQVTIWIGIILAVLFLLVLSLLRSVIQGIFLGGWRRAWVRSRTERLTASALKNFAEQNWSKAYKQLVKLASDHDDPQPYVIMAAQAAVASGDVERGREAYGRAMARFPDNSFQIRLRLGYLELGVGNGDRAAELCEQLVEENTRDPEVRLLQILVAEDRGDWEQVCDLIAAVKKQKVLSARLPIIERRCLRACLAEGAAAPLLARLADALGDGSVIPPALSIDLAQQLAMKGQPEKAEQFLRKTINRNWNADLVTAYAEIEGKSTRGQIKAAESWLGAHADDRVLLESLRRLAIRSSDEKRADVYEQKIAALTHSTS